MILLDTSVLVGAFTAPASLWPAYRRALSEGHRFVTSALVLYEWQRGPRHPDELAAVEFTFPSTKVIPFGVEEAGLAAGLYRKVASPRRRETDLAIAATALAWEAELWTLNSADFRDIPGLQLYHPLS